MSEYRIITTYTEIGEALDAGTTVETNYLENDNDWYELSDGFVIDIKQYEYRVKVEPYKPVKGDEVMGDSAISAWEFVCIDDGKFLCKNSIGEYHQFYEVVPVKRIPTEGYVDPRHIFSKGFAIRHPEKKMIRMREVK